MKFPDAAEEPLKGSIEQGGKKWGRRQSSLRGPKRAMRLCVFGILLPALFISIPIYLKFHVYDPQLYPMAVSDMRLVEGKISTTWCQGNVIHSNTSFNAFLMPDKPEIAVNHNHVEMTRQLLLDDDMKEYWGFYLLKGSTITVSSCSRHPGASMILIKGHRHLHECAYIGDDSSEEMDEILEAAEEAKLKERAVKTAPSNRVDLLKKHRPEVQFADQTNTGQTNSTFSAKQNAAHNDKDDQELKTVVEMRNVLEKLSLSRTKLRANMQTVNSDSESLELLTKRPRGHHKTFDNVHQHRDPAFGKEGNGNIEFATTAVPTPLVESDEQLTSIEVFEKMLRKLQRLGARGKKVLEDLKREMLEDIKEEQLEKKNTTSAAESEDKAATTTSQPLAETKYEKLLRERRSIILKTALEAEFNSNDEESENQAQEDGFVPDGHADDHRVINETTLDDKSNSEFWSSFSSSEEALLNCAGLILSLPLNPNRFCDKKQTREKLDVATLPNTITYTVTTNGYYFVVFSSENEVQQNYLRVNFDLKKVVYDVSQPLQQCSNFTGQCTLPLNFFTNEKVVIEVPVNEGRQVGNEEFIFVSECQPRTSIYLICLLAVPCFILAFAFQ